MLSFAAKLAGVLLVLGAIGVAAVTAHEHSPGTSFSEKLARSVRPISPATHQAASSSAAVLVRPPRTSDEKDDLSAIGPAIDDLLSDQPTAEIGVAVRWSNGETLYMRNASEPFPLASVSKTYMLVAYLHRLEIEQRPPDPYEVELLQSMIDVSDNDAAQEIWDALGGLEAMQGYLKSIAMTPLMEPPLAQEDESDSEQREAWGDVSQTASQMSLFLARLWQRELLSDDSTKLASTILGSVVEEQAWGVPTEVNALDPSAKVLVKNGWYPEDDGSWRINSTGIVIPGQGEPYVVVIFGKGFDSWSDGIETVDAVATLINQLLLP